MRTFKLALGLAALLCLGASLGAPETLTATSGSDITHFDLGNRDFVRGDYLAAIAEYRQEVAQTPASPWATEARFLIGEALVKLGRYQEAVAAYRDVLAAAPQWDRRGEVWYALGAAHAALLQWAEAAAAYREATAVETTSDTAALANLALGGLYLDATSPVYSPQQAVTRFRVAAVTADPQAAAAARVGLAQAFLAVGRVSDAMLEASAMAEHAPTPGLRQAARMVLASAYTARREFDRAAALLAEPGALQPAPQASNRSQVLDVQSFNQAANMQLRQQGALLNLLGAPTMRASARQMSFDEKTGRLSLSQEVRIVRGPVVITADRGTADLAREQVSCEGNVRLETERVVLTADRADVDYRTGEAHLSGRVRLVKNPGAPNEQVSVTEALTYSLGGEAARASGGK